MPRSSFPLVNDRANSNLKFPLTQVRDPSNGDFNNWNACYPGPNMRWTNTGTITIDGIEWYDDAHLTMRGDPTEQSGGNYATIGLNTGANHDCNALWKCDPIDATERQVRGLYFINYTNGVKFRPRISGVALQYSKQDGATKYYDLGYKRSYNVWDKRGDLGYEGVNSNNSFWGVARKGKYGDPFHDPEYRLSGVLFHFETTWKSGSPIDCNVYIKNLRFITDAKQQGTPYYNNNYRIWGWDVK